MWPVVVEVIGMHRRQLLRLAPGGAALLPGCLDSFTADPTPTTPTPTPPIESQVSIPDCPEKPDPLTRENVVEYAVRFENAYVTREILDEHARITSVTFIRPVGDWAEPSVTESGDGFVVRFGARVSYDQQRYDSTRARHVDEPNYTANYFVSRERVLRAESGREESVDPREDGSAVRCPPE